MRRLLLACGLVLGGALALVSRSTATATERAAALPGDALVPSPPLTTTRAITIVAPPAAVWPWLAQLGQGRGGFYSHTWLENLIGCQIENAAAIHPEWQALEMGDEIRMHPKAPPLVVREVRPPRALVLGEPGVQSWAFALQDAGTGRTRLLVRSRGSFGLPAWLAPLLEPGHAVMERAMLRGIRDRAEGRV